MSAVKSVFGLFDKPKVPKPVPVAVAAPPAPVDTTVGQDAIGQAQLLARQQARRRAGLAALVYSGSATAGSTSTPRTQSGGLIGS